VPPRSPVALADALEQLLTDRERRRAMGAAGRARVRQHFSSRRLERELSALYDQLGGRT
jgi:D-inositol-3-phosphate glycosyltransferase